MSPGGPLFRAIGWIHSATCRCDTARPALRQRLPGTDRHSSHRCDGKQTCQTLQDTFEPNSVLPAQVARLWLCNYARPHKSSHPHHTCASTAARCPHTASCRTCSCIGAHTMPHDPLTKRTDARLPRKPSARETRCCKKEHPGVAPHMWAISGTSGSSGFGSVSSEQMDSSTCGITTCRNAPCKRIRTGTCVQASAGSA